MIFRYPGAKTRFRKAIMSLAPAHYTEFREPFVGGVVVTMPEPHTLDSVTAHDRLETRLAFPGRLPLRSFRIVIHPFKNLHRRK